MRPTFGKWDNVILGQFHALGTATRTPDTIDAYAHMGLPVLLLWNHGHWRSDRRSLEEFRHVLGFDL